MYEINLRAHTIGLLVYTCVKTLLLDEHTGTLYTMYEKNTTINDE